MIREIAPRVYVETGFHGANVGFIVTGEGMILIDTPLLPDDARLWLKEIRSRTEQEITFIVKTDHHRGHILGNHHSLPSPGQGPLCWRSGDYRPASLSVSK